MWMDFKELDLHKSKYHVWMKEQRPYAFDK